MSNMCTSIKHGHSYALEHAYARVHTRNLLKKLTASFNRFKMPSTVEEGFRKFHRRLTPTGTESEAAKRHRKSIEACLKTKFGITGFFRSGSFGNGTSIRRFSDVDYFAVIPMRNPQQNSNYLLQKIRRVLDNRFPNTGVVVRSPAVILPFGTDECDTTEIIPANLIENTGDYGIYDIPDGNGGWIKSSPVAHSLYVNKVNVKLSRKVKPLIRFLKAWKYYKNVPITSFYLELRVAKYANRENSIVYSRDVRNILKHLMDIELSSIRDPMKVSGFIPACTSEARKKESISKMSTAYNRANKAREAEEQRKIPDAFDLWNLLYNGNFPAYR